MKIPPVKKGYNRQWVKCKECGAPSYYDYVPYSLSNPIKILPCGHGLTEKFSKTVYFIDADEAMRLLKPKEPTRILCRGGLGGRK
jgi:hypothetical protein